MQGVIKIAVFSMLRKQYLLNLPKRFSLERQTTQKIGPS